MNKKCKKCKVEKPLTEFHKKLDGHQPNCKACRKSTQKKNRPALNAYMRDWRSQNPEKVSKNNRNCRAKNLEKRRESDRERYYNNKDYFFAANAKRRASLKNQTPPWLTKKHEERIREFFRIAETMTRMKLGVFHVDHIHPISKGGLHVPWNLRVITKEENLSKGNRLLRIS